MQPRCRHIVVIENGFNRALGNAGLTVDAMVGMDVDHVCIFKKQSHGQTFKQALSLQPLHGSVTTIVILDILRLE